MVLTKEKKTEIMDGFRTHAKDTGSAAVQIALLSKRIEELAQHLKVHKKDFSSRRGLLMKVGRRNTLLKYLGRKDPERLKKVKKRLNLR